MCDVSDFDDIRVVAQFGSEVTDSSIAHNGIIKGDYLYVSYYNDGLWIFDISEPENPTVAGFYDTFPSEQKDDYRGAWGVYAHLPSGNILISDRQTGLYLLDPSEAIGATDVTSIVNNQLDGRGDVIIYPQPFEQSFTIQLPDFLNVEGTWQLYDLQGRKQKAEMSVVNEHMITINSTKKLSSGTYILQLKSPIGDLYTWKVVKM